MARRRQVRRPTAARGGQASWLAIPLFGGLFAVCVIVWNLPPAVGWLYLAASTLCFLVYAWDKFQAGRGGWRTPEARLHWLALLGGWPGALLAQQLLRHKSVKAEFRTLFWLTVMLNVAAFILLASPPGRRLIGF